MGNVTTKIAQRLRAGMVRSRISGGHKMRLGRNVSFSGHTVQVGRRAIIFRNTEILGPVTIGDDVFINRDAYIRSGVTIGNNVAIGPFVRIITDSHELGGAERRAGANLTEPVSIGDGAWIGASSTILGGVNIGAGSVIAAGSLVRSDVPPNTLVAGVPARFMREL